jgi:hypothetical protein
MRTGDHMKGYISGAKTDPEEKTIKAPSASKITTKGISHHFFSCFKNNRNSLPSCHMTRAL